jgi:hydrogenase-4 component F
VTALLWVVILPPLAGLAALVPRATVRLCGGALVLGACTSLGAAIAMMVLSLGRSHAQSLSGFLYVDPLAAFFAFTVSLVVLLASLGSVAYVGAEREAGVLSAFQVRLYFGFFSVFASGMLASMFAGNLGLLWVLIEASTLASAALVGLEAKARSLEAAWKYIIISSFGVTIALVATVFLFYSGSALHLTSDQRLTWFYLFAHAHALQPASLRLAFLLAVIGYGTKVGLAPMHTWLPDAHSEAPSPASAMLSAGLLNTGMYAIIRFEAIARAGLGNRYPETVLLTFGFVTMAVGVLFMVRRGNYKRLFAYSSIEHMGIVSVALGFGGTLGMFGALLQVLNHAIAKSVLFLTSGHFVLGYHSREISDVRGAIGALPFAGGVLLLASLAVAGTPPFGVFLSELTIVRAGFTGTAPLVVGLFLLFVVIGFVVLVGSALAMTIGESPRAPSVPYPHASGRVLAAIPLIGGLGFLLVLGVFVPSGLSELLLHAVRAVS